jgi:hypothetical protein
MLMLVRVLVQCRNMAKDEEIVSECVSEDALQVATSLLTRCSSSCGRALAASAASC